MSLRKQMAYGALWSLVEKIGQQGLSFFIFMYLARVVGPEEFGLVTMCYIYTSFVYMIIFGFVDGIVSLRIRDDVALSSLFWGIMCIGCLLGGFGIFLAGPYAAMIGDNRIALLFCWNSIVPLLLAFSAVPTMLVMASLNFRIYSIRTLVSTLSGGIVGITMAYHDFGAYALIGQQISHNIIMNLIIWPNCGWKPILVFDRAMFLNVLAPGIKMVGSSLVRFFDQQAPRLLIGFFLGPVSVGYFAFAVKFRQVLYDVLVHPMAVVVYPVFSKINENQKEQLELLHQIIVIAGSFVFPAIAGIIVMSDLFVPLFFGKDWVPAISVLQILLVSGSTLPFLILLRDVMRAHNKMADYLRVQVWLVIFTIGSTLVVAPYGLIALSYVLVVISLVSLPIFIYSIKKSTKLSLWRSFYRLWAPAFSSCVMVLFIIMFRLSFFYPNSLLISLFVEVLLGTIIYMLVALITQPKEIRIMAKLASKLLTNIK